MANDERPHTGGRSFDTLLRDYEDRLSLRKPADLILLMMGCMPLYGAFRVCIEANIFRRLALASPKSLSITDLAQNIPGISEENTDSTDAASREEYITRMLRGVCALNFVDEVGPGEYLANELTRTMAEPGFEAGFNFCFDATFGPKSSVVEMLNWSKNNGYKAPSVSTDGPYQQARDIVGTTAFEDWGKTRNLLDLSVLMQKMQENRVHWTEWFPGDNLFGISETSEVFVVDVGGSLGHDLSALARRYPKRQMRLILQDQPDVLREARRGDLDPRIELMEHNFFNPQPVRNAGIYYMHKIMHDWPEEECIKILSHLRDAMAPTSRIFINDIVLPDRGGPILYPALDVMMFSMLSAKERSEVMWRQLVTQVEGLEIVKVWQVPELRGEGIVEIRRVGS